MSMISVRERATAVPRHDGPAPVNGIVSAAKAPFRRLVEKTTDPEARALAEATIIFRAGLKKARDGNVAVALPMIATAYLMDSRAMNFVLILPELDRQQASLQFLDMNLLQELENFEAGTNIASQIMQIYSAIQFGQMDGKSGQTRMVQALAMLDQFIKQIDADPTLESPERGFLRGSMKRTTLYQMRATLLIALGSTKSALRELTAALHLDPTLTSVRCTRACLYSSTTDGYPDFAIKEFLKVVDESHPDSSDLSLAYAWLAKLILENLDLGSVEEAQNYWTESRKAAARYEEIYGEEPFSPVEEEMKALLGNLKPVVKVPKEQHSCRVCGLYTNRVGGKLFKCSRCKNVRYCSTECQQNDWEDHWKECQKKNPGSQDETQERSMSIEIAKMDEVNPNEVQKTNAIIQDEIQNFTESSPEEDEEEDPLSPDQEVTKVLTNSVKEEEIEEKEPETRNACKVCGLKKNRAGGKLFKCSRCKGTNGVRYCSSECQQNDWENHWKECKARDPMTQDEVISILDDQESDKYKMDHLPDDEEYVEVLESELKSQPDTLCMSPTDRHSNRARDRAPSDRFQKEGKHTFGRNNAPDPPASVKKKSPADPPSIPSGFFRHFCFSEERQESSRIEGSPNHDPEETTRSSRSSLRLLDPKEHRQTLRSSSSALDPDEGRKTSRSFPTPERASIPRMSRVDPRNDSPLRRVNQEESEDRRSTSHSVVSNRSTSRCPIPNIDNDSTTHVEPLRNLVKSALCNSAEIPMTIVVDEAPEAETAEHLREINDDVRVAGALKNEVDVDVKVDSNVHADKDIDANVDFTETEDDDHDVLDVQAHADEEVDDFGDDQRDAADVAVDRNMNLSSTNHQDDPPEDQLETTAALTGSTTSSLISSMNDTVSRLHIPNNVQSSIRGKEYNPSALIAPVKTFLKTALFNTDANKIPATIELGKKEGKSALAKPPSEKQSSATSSSIKSVSVKSSSANSTSIKSASSRQAPPNVPSLYYRDHNSSTFAHRQSTLQRESDPLSEASNTTNLDHGTLASTTFHQREVSRGTLETEIETSTGSTTSSTKSSATLKTEVKDDSSRDKSECMSKKSVKDFTDVSNVPVEAKMTPSKGKITSKRGASSSPTNSTRSLHSQKGDFDVNIEVDESKSPSKVMVVSEDSINSSNVRITNIDQASISALSKTPIMGGSVNSTVSHLVNEENRVLPSRTSPSMEGSTVSVRSHHGDVDQQASPTVRSSKSGASANSTLWHLVDVESAESPTASFGGSANSEISSYVDVSEDMSETVRRSILDGFTIGLESSQRLEADFSISSRQLRASAIEDPVSAVISQLVDTDESITPSTMARQRELLLDALEFDAGNSVFGDSSISTVDSSTRSTRSTRSSCSLHSTRSSRSIHSTKSSRSLRSARSAHSLSGISIFGGGTISSVPSSRSIRFKVKIDDDSDDIEVAVKETVSLPMTNASSVHSSSSIPHRYAVASASDAGSAPSRRELLESAMRGAFPSQSSTIPQEPLADLMGQELCNARLRDYLCTRCEYHGERFANWWHGLSTTTKTQVLHGVTAHTIPLYPSSLSQIAKLLETGDPKYNARTLTDLSISTLVGPCDCPDDDTVEVHEYRDQLLHDLHYFVGCWDLAEGTDYAFCVHMVDDGIFPDFNAEDEDRVLSFYEPPADDADPYVHSIFLMKNLKPQARMPKSTLFAIESVQAMKEAGFLKEKVPFEYHLLRDTCRLMLYTLIFEQFDTLERKEPILMPLSRLLGCDYCKRDCCPPALPDDSTTVAGNVDEEIMEMQDCAVQCQGCHKKWYCCYGCYEASDHAAMCTMDKESPHVVLFG